MRMVSTFRSRLLDCIMHTTTYQFGGLKTKFARITDLLQYFTPPKKLMRKASYHKLLEHGSTESKNIREEPRTFVESKSDSISSTTNLNALSLQAPLGWVSTNPTFGFRHILGCRLPLKASIRDLVELQGTAVGMTINSGEMVYALESFQTQILVDLGLNLANQNHLSECMIYSSAMIRSSSKTGMFFFRFIRTSNLLL